MTSQNNTKRQEMSASQAELYRLALGASKILKAMGRSQQRLAGAPPPIATTVVAQEIRSPTPESGTDAKREEAQRREAPGTVGRPEPSDHGDDDRPSTPTTPTQPSQPSQPSQPTTLPVARVPSNALHRAMSFASLGAKLIVGSAVDSIRGRLSNDPPSNSSSDSSSNLSSNFITAKNAERLANHLSRLRGAALKLSQVLSMQDENVLPPQVQEALERVRAGADVMPADQLESMMRSQLGDDWRDKFVEFDEEPMAAASIGQVHAATIVDGDTAGDTVGVVVKVQYPGVAKSINSDIDNLVRLTRFAQVLPPGLYVENAVKVAKKELALECDYSYERYVLNGDDGDRKAADEWMGGTAHSYAPTPAPTSIPTPAPHAFAILRPHVRSFACHAYIQVGTAYIQGTGRGGSRVHGRDAPQGAARL